MSAADEPRFTCSNKPVATAKVLPPTLLPAALAKRQRMLKVKRERALLNLAQVALGFIPGIPSFIKSAANTFIDSMHKEQRLLEGALVAHFELAGNAPMVNEVYRQNINPYLVR